MCQQSISFNCLLRRIQQVNRSRKNPKVKVKKSSKRAKKMRVTGRFLTMLDSRRRTGQSRTSGFSTRSVETGL